MKSSSNRGRNNVLEIIIWLILRSVRGSRTLSLAFIEHYCLSDALYVSQNIKSQALVSPSNGKKIRTPKG
jgi:hypothetical protein